MTASQTPELREKLMSDIPATSDHDLHEAPGAVFETTANP